MFRIGFYSRLAYDSFYKVYALWFSSRSNMLDDFWCDVLVDPWAEKEKHQVTNSSWVSLGGLLLRPLPLGQFAFFTVRSHLPFHFINTIALFLSFIPKCHSWPLLCDIYLNLLCIKHAWILLHLFQKLHLVLPCSTISIQLNSAIISWWTITYRPLEKALGGHKVKGNKFRPCIQWTFMDNK